ncbi:MAG: DUF3737 family protein, partial [Clostridia bacterium]|nr:DUF3737 family protein [Clostridia bacterium]
MKTVIENVRLGEERALYALKNALLKNVAFDGEEDGESAVKECRNIEAENCYCNLRYPFWHVTNLKIRDSEMTELCRAALWYCKNIHIENTKMFGIKALRECAAATIIDSEIISPEFGWSVNGVTMKNVRAESEYFMMRSRNLNFEGVSMKGKYSFQYIKDAVFENCSFDTKDAFWHSKNVVVKNSFVKGEYLGWYSEGLTFINCTITGTQPLCYCKNLKLVDCKMYDTDLCFEKSETEANILTPVISIKNPYRGSITVPEVGEIIRDDR